MGTRVLPRLAVVVVVVADDHEHIVAANSPPTNGILWLARDSPYSPPPTSSALTVPKSCQNSYAAAGTRLQNPLACQGSLFCPHSANKQDIELLFLPQHLQSYTISCVCKPFCLFTFTKEGVADFLEEFKLKLSEKVRMELWNRTAIGRGRSRPGDFEIQVRSVGDVHSFASFRGKQLG